MQKNRPKIIVLTGPESTGKSTLVSSLSEHFKALSFPEHARVYLENKGLINNYTFNDVDLIAKGQVKQYSEALKSNSPYVFLDTWLIITRIWFKWVYGNEPAWLDDAIIKMPIDLYLLCEPDIDWHDDPLRENGGDNRIKLYNEYKTELTNANANWVSVNGIGEQRLQNAIAQVNKVFNI